MSEEMEVVSDKRSGTIQSVSIAARFLKILANAENELPLGRSQNELEPAARQRIAICKAL